MFPLPRCQGGRATCTRPRRCKQISRIWLHRMFTGPMEALGSTFQLIKSCFWTTQFFIFGPKYCPATPTVLVRFVHTGPPMAYIFVCSCTLMYLEYFQSVFAYLSTLMYLNMILCTFKHIINGKTYFRGQTNNGMQHKQLRSRQLLMCALLCTRCNRC
jgi:hypothetical protein